MFKKPFSFDGRIGRTEYCLTYLGYWVCLIAIQSVSVDSLATSLFTICAIVPLIWILTAQGAKRCHDRNNIGWYQIIPFYFLWMLFAPGDLGENDFGPSPKQSAEIPA
ncbi:DUF805 domain-containing protein [Dyadobacter endophyticus]|uniref:DUF805 domain-containing protein n=1 Tax=Dyadobacter endophyticus TaxID=1749036 RepID=UPI003CF94F70